MATWTAPRTWVTAEVVTASLLNTHLRDDMNVGRGYGSASRLTGSITLNSSVWANASTTLDITLAGAANDRVRYTPNFQDGNEALSSFFDARFVASGNNFGKSTSNSHQGMAGWAGQASAYSAITGSAIKTVVSGDISGGNVIVRLRYRLNSTATRTVFATSAVPLFLYAENVGPAV